VQQVRIAIALGEMRAPRLDALVGGGTLQAEIAGQVVDLAWFTNAKQAAFGRVVAYLEDLTRYQAALLADQAEAVAPVPVEETEEEPIVPTVICCFHKAPRSARHASTSARSSRGWLPTWSPTGSRLRCSRC